MDGEQEVEWRARRVDTGRLSGVGERKEKGAIGVDDGGMHGARARLAARHGGTREIRERERALSPEVLRRVSPRGILGYVRVVQELADNELARSAWCRCGSRFRGVSSFLFFFVTSCRHARTLDHERVKRANEQAKEWCVHVVCVCPTISLVRSPTVLPVVLSYVARLVPTYDRHRRRRRYRHRRLRHLRRLHHPLESRYKNIRKEHTFYHLGVTSDPPRNPTHPTRV